MYFNAREGAYLELLHVDGGCDRWCMFSEIRIERADVDVGTDLTNLAADFWRWRSHERKEMGMEGGRSAWDLPLLKLLGGRLPRDRSLRLDITVLVQFNTSAPEYARPAPLAYLFTPEPPAA